MTPNTKPRTRFFTTPTNKKKVSPSSENKKKEKASGSQSSSYDSLAVREYLLVVLGINKARTKRPDDGIYSMIPSCHRIPDEAISCSPHLSIHRTATFQTDRRSVAAIVVARSKTDRSVTFLSSSMLIFLTRSPSYLERLKFAVREVHGCYHTGEFLPIMNHEGSAAMNP